MAPCTMGWALPHWSLIEIMSYTWISWRYFFNWGSIFFDVSSCVKLTKPASTDIYLQSLQRGHLPFSKCPGASWVFWFHSKRKPDSFWNSLMPRQGGWVDRWWGWCLCLAFCRSPLFFGTSMKPRLLTATHRRKNSVSSLEVLWNLPPFSPSAAHSSFWFILK